MRSTSPGGGRGEGGLSSPGETDERGGVGVVGLVEA